MEQWYFVKQISTMFNAGMFVVVDGYTGNEVGGPKYLEEEADNRACRLNNEHNQEAL